MKILRYSILVVLVTIVTTVFAQDTPLAEIVITPKDTGTCKVVFNKKYPVSLEITLSMKKAKEIEDITKENIGRKVRVIIGDTVVSEPEVVSIQTGIIFGVHPKDSDDAIRLAKFLIDSK